MTRRRVWFGLLTVAVATVACGDDDSMTGPNGGNEPPIARIEANRTSVPAGDGNQTIVRLDASDSSDPDGDPLTFSWSTNCPGGVFNDPTLQSPTLTVNTGRAGQACPVNCQVTLTVTDPNGASDSCNAAVTIFDPRRPTITCSATGGQVDGNCEFVMPFSATIEDSCCIDAATVTVNVTLLTGNANLGTPVINILQATTTRVEVTGTVKVSKLTSCPAIVQVTVDAVDCCGNTPTQCVATANVVDLIPPQITCPPSITLDRGDKICNDDVQNWLDSTTATDNCDPDVDIVNDAPLCGFPYDSTTTVVWEATDDCENVSTCSSTITIEKAPRVDVSTKGSLLVFSKVEIKWDATGRVTQDTFLDLTNDFPRDVVVQLYFINGDDPADAIEVGNPPVVVERGHPGWNRVDCQIMLTKDEPTYWSALTGLNSQGGVCQPFTVLDPGSPPGRPDPDGPPGSRLLRGYVYAWAVNNAGEEIRWNHLKGDAVIVNYPATSAWEYNAYSFTTSCVDHGDEPLDCTLFDPAGVCCTAEVIPGRLDMDAFQYAFNFDKLLLDFYASGSRALSDGGATVQIDTDLTLYPVSADLRQDTRGPVHTKALFDIWNQNEIGFSGTHRCIWCWDQTLLSKYTEIANHFLRGNLQTDKGKARIDGESSNVCEANPGRCDAFRECLTRGIDSVAGGRPDGDDFFFCRHEHFDQDGLDFDCTRNDPLLGVSAKILMFSGTASGRAYAGSPLVGQGEEDARILYDIIEPPDELIIGSRDGAPIEADVTDNPRINRTPTKASKRGR
ncbi:MAG: hypothetical protein IIA27_16215 [Gemmatimonadetes bacterium]|nr:hypothetical protein [Gemmatimonadota bacterium]